MHNCVVLQDIKIGLFEDLIQIKGWLPLYIVDLISKNVGSTNRYNRQNIRFTNICTNIFNLCIKISLRHFTTIEAVVDKETKIL